MGLDKGLKENIRKKYRLHQNDSASADVQIATFTEYIKLLENSVKANSKDKQQKIKLLKALTKRRRLINYLYATDSDRCYALEQKLKADMIDEDLVGVDLSYTVTPTRSFLSEGDNPEDSDYFSDEVLEDNEYFEDDSVAKDSTSKNAENSEDMEL